jgi:dihydrofolate synthase/folylpolyglutamate synthase
MSFASALDSLHALGAELAAPGAPRRKFDLAFMRVLAESLGSPQTTFPSVLIAGTNGKGSTASTLAHILAAAGLRTALYTSPHLVRVTERIRTNTPPESLETPAALHPEAFALGVTPWTPANIEPAPSTSFHEIPEADFARLYFQVDEAGRRLVAEGRLPHPPSYFETLTALAFLYFAEQRVDLAVLEVGLGGRLDATNIVEPLASILTDIALDHQDYLGPTITDIAREKAGILRPNGTLITLPQHPEANHAIGEAAAALNVRGINAADFLPGRGFTPERTTYNSQLTTSPLPRNIYTLTLDGHPIHIASPLFGEHQQRNLALAIAAAHELRTHDGFHIPNAAIEAGIAATSWPGRLEFLPPNLLLDVAHNPAGAWTLRAAIAALPESQPRTLLFSCLRDKDLTEIAQILFPLFDSDDETPSSASRPSPAVSFRPERSEVEKPASAPAASRPRNHIVLAPIDNPRAASLEQLKAAAAALQIPAHAAANHAEALALARQITPPDGLILCTGSIYLVGAIRELVS